MIHPRKTQLNLFAETCINYCNYYIFFS